MKILAFTFVSLMISVGSTVDYCKRELCYRAKHIACDNLGDYASNCPPDRSIIDITEYKGVITHLHNYYRNVIANGSLPRYEPAARMGTMIWDDELAKLAELNVKTCKFNHDCHNTPRFRISGQNLAGATFFKEYPQNVTELLEQAVSGWFNEHPIIDMSYIREFRADENFIKYGHFTELVVDRNTHVGCAAIQFTEPDYEDFLIVTIACNYGSSHRRGYPVYESGSSASKCKTGHNLEYPALCSLQEEIDPLYF